MKKFPDFYQTQTSRQRTINMAHATIRAIKIQTKIQHKYLNQMIYEGISSREFLDHEVRRMKRIYNYSSCELEAWSNLARQTNQTRWVSFNIFAKNKQDSDAMRTSIKGGQEAE